MAKRSFAGKRVLLTGSKQRHRLVPGITAGTRGRLCCGYVASG